MEIQKNIRKKEGERVRERCAVLKLNKQLKVLYCGSTDRQSRSWIQLY